MIPVVLVPYHLAHRDFEVGLGAARIAKSLQWLHEIVELSDAPASDIDAVSAVNALLAREVRAALAAVRRVLVLAGNCSTATGTLAGMDSHETGIVWFDAHGDFNTPDTTISGSIEGMALAVATGACHSSIRAAAGLAQPVAEYGVLLAGTRDLDPGETLRLQQSTVHIVPSERWTLENFRRHAEKVRTVSSVIYLHLDLDVVDPTLSPGVNFQSPGGLTPQQLLDSADLLAGWPELRAVTIANYNPNRDPEGVTMRLALRLAAILGRSA